MGLVHLLAILHQQMCWLKLFNANFLLIRHTYVVTGLITENNLTRLLDFFSSNFLLVIFVVLLEYSGICVNMQLSEIWF